MCVKVRKVMEVKAVGVEAIRVLKVRLWQRVDGSGFEHECCPCNGWCEWEFSSGPSRRGRVRR